MSRTRFSNHQHPTRMLRYTKQGVGRVELNIHKHYIPPFFELLVRLKEKRNRINLINSIRMQVSLNVL